MKAFTLIEVLVTITLVSLISITVMPIGINQFERENVVAASRQFVDNIQLMQQYAFSRRDDDSYGIKIESNGYYIYQGSSFATATVTDFYEFSNSSTLVSTNLGGGTEINFNSGDMIPDVNGTIVIGRGSVSYTIDINAAGNVRYYRN